MPLPVRLRCTVEQSSLRSSLHQFSEGLLSHSPICLYVQYAPLHAKTAGSVLVLMPVSAQKNGLAPTVRHHRVRHILAFYRQAIIVLLEDCSTVYFNLKAKNYSMWQHIITVPKRSG
jgi:hypothetical protein